MTTTDTSTERRPDGTDPELSTDQAADETIAVAGAVETSEGVSSHLHPGGSFAVEDHPVPTGREEVWRFTPMKRLRPMFDALPTDDREGGDRAASYEEHVPAPATFATLAPGQSPRGTVLVPADRPAAIASAQTEQAGHVVVPAETELSEPIRIDVVGRGAGRRANSHLVIEAGAYSKATVVLHHRGSCEHNGNLEVLVGEGAKVTVISIQDWDDDALHTGQHEARVGRDAEYQHIAVSFGGDVVRLACNVSYETSGGSAELLGLYFVDAGQHIEHRLFVDHNRPKSRSNVDYRGALQGDGARSVWIGDVLIRQAAEGIETYESNRNLVLTDGARADSVPNLEIETGEIAGAGHASTTGRFDDEQLFYLRSRGIEESEARRLVVHGFFADIIRRIGIDEVEELLLAAVERELETTVGTPTLSA